MKNKIFFASFMAVWVILIVLNFIIKTPEFSESENRYMTKFPKFKMEDLISGKYSAKMDDYINDHFVFRNEWLNIRAIFEKEIGKDEISNVYLGKDGYLFPKVNKINIDKELLEKKINLINEFNEKSKVKVYTAIIPNSSYINREKLPKNAPILNQEKFLDGIYNRMSTQNINTVSVLEKNKNNQLYFKLDHHMTSKGAFLVYKEITKKMLNKEANESDYEIEKVTDSFYGTSYSEVNLKSLKPDEIYIYKNKNINVEKVEYDNETTKSIYNFDYLNKKDKYSMFLNGNNSKVRVTTNLKNGEKLLVLKDSYAHILSQFLINDYEQIDFIDLRYYNGNISKYIEDNDIDKVLILYNVTNFIEDIGLNRLR